MHGARRRLDERLSELMLLRGRYVCQTIDSFAGHLVQRWHSLHKHLSLRRADFDEICDACGCMLEQAFVCTWVTATYPVIVRSTRAEAGETSNSPRPWSACPAICGSG
jgi:hypothetical protein